MRLLIRYGGAALVVTTLAIFAIAPFVATFVQQWTHRDIELRATLVFNSVREELSGLLARNAADRIGSLFERLALDERLLAVGFCDETGALRFGGNAMPADVTCQSVARTDRESFSTIRSTSRPVIVASFPLSGGAARGHLVLVHDLTFAEQRAVQAQTWVIVALAGIALVGAALASFIAVLVMRGWLHSVQRAISDLRTGQRRDDEAPDNSVLGTRIRDLLRELDETRRSIDASHSDWNQETLRSILVNQLPNTEIVVVSNREPYIHNHGPNGVTVQIPASGLVAAIEPIMRACGGTWIAHGSGSADRELVDAGDSLRVPPESPSYTLRRVWLSDEEQDGYYYGLANEGLWPLCHIAFVRPIFRQTDWEQYRAVNARFAQAALDQTTRPDPIIMIQDYHLALVPKMIRERLPEATIITFWHIPWPNSETFGICPWKEEIISGLLGSTVLGFHTQFHCNNFVDTVDRFVESRIDREHASITIGGHETFVRPYPISIEWPPAALAGQPPVIECCRAVRQRCGLAADIRLGVGIERFDYTKGILDRLRAVDSLLTNHPEWKGRFAFIQVAAPTRSKLPAYLALQSEAKALANEINARHGGATYQPILLVVEHHEPEQIFELFRAADLCVVSSLHDGMNLVAKEFVAARDDEQGVLILSSFAGASRELADALIVNPYDAHAMSEAIHRALSMPEGEQRARMRVMRDVVRARNVYRWAGRMLLDAAQLRKRQEIMVMTSRTRSETSGPRRSRVARLLVSR